MIRSKTLIFVVLLRPFWYASLAAASVPVSVVEDHSSVFNRCSAVATDSGVFLDCIAGITAMCALIHIVRAVLAADSVCWDTIAIWCCCNICV